MLIRSRVTLAFLGKGCNEILDRLRPACAPLHYFDDQDRGFPQWQRRLNSHAPGCRRWRNELRYRDHAHIRWTLHYFFGQRSDAWYASLFDGKPGQVRGEITPRYSLLQESASSISAPTPNAAPSTCTSAR